MAKKPKVKWVCTACGALSPKLQGKCFNCGGWNTIEEEPELSGKSAQALKTSIVATENEKAKKLSDIERELYKGFPTGMKELDRVFGGQIVRGSVTLIAGEPGQGKSTVLSQLAAYVSTHVGTVLYSSGEESQGQGKKRIEERMKLESGELYLLHTRNIETIEREIVELDPKLVIVDSIQMVADPDIASNVGGVTQVNACTARLIHVAKTTGCAIVIVGQVTKNNGIAGPKQLEHMVDTVLYLEGEKFNDLRLIRVPKNRFGSSDELGVFQMKSKGLEEVLDPSQYMLSDRLDNASGSAVVCISDTRPLLIEVQALVSPPIIEGTYPKRRTYGFDTKRLDIVLSVLEKVLEKRKLAYKDVIVNIAGGMKIEEPGADLGVAMAVYSSDTKQPIDPGKDTRTLILGEVGLVGEVRPVSNIERLVKEAERAGFTHCILPRKNAEQVEEVVKNMTLIPVRTVKEAINKLFPN